MSENENTTEAKVSCIKSDKLPYIIIIVLLVIIAVLMFFVGRNYTALLSMNGVNTSDSGAAENIANTTQTGDVAAVEMKVKVIGDKRCPDCQTDAILDQLKKLPFLSKATFEKVDFADAGVKDIVKANDIKALPAFLFDKKNGLDPQFVQYLQDTPTGLYSLNVGAEFDPFGEICGNGKDDNGDGKIDCADPKCAQDISCAPKVDKPVADLYIMSYCPYGLQAQKGYLEVMSKLGKVADVNIKFVQYVMHGQKEADENVVQYCIQKEQKPTYTKYLNCYLQAEGKDAECRKSAGIDEKKLTTCIDSTKKKYKVDENMADTSKQFPDFTIYKDEAEKVGVQGSPTFVLNGIKMDKIGRSAKAYADAICSTFKKKPKECEQAFQDITFDPMFGFTSNGSNANSGCGK